MSKKTILMIMLILLVFPVSASANIDKLLPSEEEMGFVPEKEFIYKKYPNSHYGWDTIHEWITMKGIKVIVGNTDELIKNATYNPWMDFNIALSRLNIFFLQMGFNNSVFEQAISGLDKRVAPFASYMIDNAFWLCSLFLAGIIILKYAQGRIGEAIGAIVKSTIYSAIIFGIVTNLEWILVNIGGMVDYFSLLVLGLMSFAPFTGGDAIDVANNQVMDISNIIFKYYIDSPWTFGQYGDVHNIPVVTLDEQRILNDVEIVAAVGDSWKDIHLSYPTGSPERKGMAALLTDETVEHDPNLDPTLFESGGGVRIFAAGLSTLMAVTGVPLHAGVGGIQFISKLGVILFSVIIPALAILSFLGDMGTRLLKKAAGIWLFLFALTIAATIFVGIPIVAVNLLLNDGIHPFWAYIILIVVNIVAFILLPHIWKTITPMLLKGVSNVVQSIGNAKARLTRDKTNSKGGQTRTSAPVITPESLRQNIYQQYERHKDRKRNKVESATVKPPESVPMNIQMEQQLNVQREEGRVEIRSPEVTSNVPIEAMSQEESLKNHIDESLKENKVEIINNQNTLHKETEAKQKLVNEKSNKQTNDMKKIEKEIKKINKKLGSNDNDFELEAPEINLTKN